jgi:multiple sugar transport system substrate-binding protein
MSIKKPSGRTTTAAAPRPLEPGPSKPSPLNRRTFRAGAAVLGASLATAGCAGTYDVASGLTGSSGGANNSTLVYWNLLTGGDGTHMEAMEAYYTKTHPGVNLQSTILTWR